MRIKLNGEPRAVPDDATVADVLTLLAVPPSGVAVAVDGSVVRRAEWTAHGLTEGAAVEVLTAVQGG